MLNEVVVNDWQTVPPQPPALRLLARPLIASRMLDTPFMSAHEKIVYIGLCHHIGSRGYADVTFQRLADDFGLTRNCVRHVIKKLVKVGVIKQVRRQGTRSIFYLTGK